MAASRMRLVFAVGERLRRSDGDRVAGVRAHRIEVLDGADDDDVVGEIAHHLKLVLFPSEHRFFEQHFVDRETDRVPRASSSSSSSRL